MIIGSRRFIGLTGREIAKELCEIMHESRERNYEEIAEYLIMIANRGHYNFLYKFLKKYPIDLSSETAQYTIDAIKDFDDPLLSVYGKYADEQYRLFQSGYYGRIKNLYLDEFLDHSGPRYAKITDYDGTSKSTHNVAYTYA